MSEPFGVPSVSSDAEPPIVIVADHFLPTPDHDAGSHRLVAIMDILSAMGASVVFFPVTGPPNADTSALTNRGVGVVSTGYQQRRFLRDHGHRVRLAFLSRPQTVHALLGALRDHAPLARVAYDTVDIHHVRIGRQADLAESSGGEGRFRLRAEAISTQAIETYFAAVTDTTITVSEYDAALIQELVPGADIRVIPTVHSGSAPSALPDTMSIGFVGNYLHAPNTDAVLWFASEVLPLIRLAIPEVVFEIIGDSPPSEILELADPGIVVRGWVPDLDDALSRIAVGIAPLRFGSGVKGKIGEMMRRSIPMVCTAVAIEGMHLRPGQDVLMADNEDEFSRHVVTLLKNRAQAEEVAESGRRRIYEFFGPERAAAQLARLLET